MNECLQNYANIAVIVGVLFNIILAYIAVLTYSRNVQSSIRNRSIENAQRYIDAMSKLTEHDGFLMSHIKDIEAGTFERDLKNKDDETKFNRLLEAYEHFALLQKAGSFPSELNAYMLGWFAQRLYPMLTDREKSEKFWELAVDFIEQTKKEADELESKSREERLNYLKKNHFQDLPNQKWIEKIIGLHK